MSVAHRPRIHSLFFLTALYSGVILAMLPAAAWAAEAQPHRQASVSAAPQEEILTATDLYTTQQPPFLREVRLGPFDTQPFVEEDAQRGDWPLRTGVAREVTIGDEDGQWEQLAGIGWLWTVRVVSDDATAIRLHFVNVTLPEGAQIAVRGESGLPLYGYYDTYSRDVQRGQFWTTEVFGDTALVEYFWPNSRVRQPALPFAIDSVMHNYHEIFAQIQGGGAREGNCHNDVTCYPEWLNERNGTCMITIVIPPDTWLCSAAMLATTTQDETPYILTARHCVGNDDEAQTVTAYFKFHTLTCNSGSATLGPVARGCTYLATHTGADQTLMMLDGALPTGVAWVGWSSVAIGAGRDVATIGHPDGAYKRITFGTTFSYDTNYIGISWYSGTVEGGNSGGGLFRTDDHLLYAVASFSTPPIDCSNPDGPSGFGKFSRFYPTIASLLVAGSDDAFEDNDDCPNAYSLGVGVYNDLIVKSTDEDWYKITVPACNRLTASAQFTNSDGNIDVDLYDACGGTLLHHAGGTSGLQSVTYDNTDSMPVDWFVHVYLVTDTRQQYQLTVTLTSLGTSTQITDQPDSQTVNVGDPVTFAVVAQGTNLSYQWYHDSDPIDGATNSTYDILSAQPSDAGDYTVLVSGDCGEETSDVATLTVQQGGCCPCAGDLSDPCNDVVNVSDFTLFAAAFGSSVGDPEYNVCADLSPPGSPNGVINVSDFTLFTGQFGQPCP
jgi:hypothetical protein